MNFCWINEDHTELNLQLDGVALFVTEPPHANSTTMQNLPLWNLPFYTHEHSVSIIKKLFNLKLLKKG